MKWHKPEFSKKLASIFVFFAIVSYCLFAWWKGGQTDIRGLFFAPTEERMAFAFSFPGLFLQFSGWGVLLWYMSSKRRNPIPDGERITVILVLAASFVGFTFSALHHFGIL